MMRSIILLISWILLCVYDLQGQKQDYVWFLGIDQSIEPGIQGMIGEKSIFNSLRFCLIPQ